MLAAFLGEESAKIIVEQDGGLTIEGLHEGEKDVKVRVKQSKANIFSRKRQKVTIGLQHSVAAVNGGAPQQAEVHAGAGAATRNPCVAEAAPGLDRSVVS